MNARRAVAAAIVTGVTVLCSGSTLTLRAQTPAPAPAPAATAPGATATAAEKQALVRAWFNAAATLDFSSLVALTDPASAEKFKLVLERVPDLALTRSSAEFKGLEKRVLEMLPQVLLLGEPVAEGENEAYVPVTIEESKVAQWVELKELVNLYVNEMDAARTQKRPAATVEEVTKRAKDNDPSFASNIRANTATLVAQSKLAPKAWLVLDHGAWKVNLTRLEKETREAAAAAKK